MRIDFHSHTFLSDGQLHPAEHLRYAQMAGHDVIAVTDHVGVTDAARVLDVYEREFAALVDELKVVPLRGVEITHVPPRLIATAARNARKAGAQIVVVHGETPDEPVAAGTNAAAVACEDVDVLAHPGFLTAEDAATAAKTGVFLELTPRRVHCHTNGIVARRAMEAGAKLVVDSDAHLHSDLLTAEAARKIALGAGLDKKAVDKVLGSWPRQLLRRGLQR